MNTHQAPKVLLTTLTERTSAKGNLYLTGWLTKARVVGFRGDDDDQGHPVWNIYLSEPEPRPAAAASGQDRPARTPAPAGKLPTSTDALAPATPRHGGGYRSQAPADNGQSPAQQQHMNRAAVDMQRRHEGAMINLNDPIPD